MLKREKKEQIVSTIIAAIRETRSALFVDFRGVKTKPIEKLRADLQQSGSTLTVIRKTLLARALSELGVMEKGAVRALEGQIAFIVGDVLAAAKACAVFAKQEKTFRFVGAVLEGKALSSKEASRLAAIPSRQELLGQLAAALEAPVRGLAIALQGIPRSLAMVLSEVNKNKQ